MKRVSVIGITGSGKTTIARRLAALLGHPFIELDSVYHQANWKPMERQKFTAWVDEIVEADTWVIDGSYREWTALGSIWRRADTVVWVRPPRREVLRQVIWRSIKNTATQRELWNGNRESLREHLSCDPKRSIIVHVWRNYEDYERMFSSDLKEDRFSHIQFVVLRSRAEAEAWLASVAADLGRRKRSFTGARP